MSKFTPKKILIELLTTEINKVLDNKTSNATFGYDAEIDKNVLIIDNLKYLIIPANNHYVAKSIQTIRELSLGHYKYT